jgi:hypothetical protein
LAHFLYAAALPWCALARRGLRRDRLEDRVASFGGAGTAFVSAFIHFTPPTRPFVAIAAPFVVRLVSFAVATASPDSDTVSLNSAFIRFMSPMQPFVAIAAPFVVRLASFAVATASPDSDTVSFDSAFIRFMLPMQPFVAITAPFVVPLASFAVATASPDSAPTSCARGRPSREARTISLDGRTRPVASRALPFA